MRHGITLWIGLSCLAASHASAGNDVHHYDNTTETFVRFGVNGPTTSPQTWYQRLPGDQIGGATGVVSTTVALLDKGPDSTEKLRFRLYQGGAFGPGALFADSGPITVSGPGVGAFFLVSIDWTGGTGVPVPIPNAPGCDVPANDIYGAVKVRAGSGGNGLLIGASIGSVGEQYNPSTHSHYNPGGSELRYLSYVRNDKNGTLVTIGGHASFCIRVGLANDVLQPFAENPARFTGPSALGDGQNPNYGYAGIWPDALAGDRVGARLGSSLAPGGLAVLYSSVATGPPIVLPGTAGVLCLAPPLRLVAVAPLELPGVNPFGPPAENLFGLELEATSEALFGPFPVPPNLPPGLLLRQQALARSGGRNVISTLATTAFP